MDNRVNSTGFSYAEGSVTAGNLTANGAGTTYSYNQENFLTAASSTLGSPTYALDAEGRRAKKTIGSTVTTYFYAGTELIGEKSNDGVADTWTDYIFFAGQRMAQQVKAGTSSSVVTYLHTDHLGSTRRCTDATGASAGTCDYEPFGENQPSTTCSVPTKFRFAGMEFDSDTALYHTWFREYDPNQGRWMSVDPLPGHEGDPQTRNRYAYARNDPVNFRDPLGLDLIWVGDCLYDVVDFYVNGQYDSTEWFLVRCTDPFPDAGGGGPTGGDPGGGQGGDVPGGGGLGGLLGNWTPPVPPPPPPTKECQAALKVAGLTGGSQQQALGRVTNAWGTLQAAASIQGIDPGLLAAIGIRETGFRNITGDHGHGHGVFQFDDRYNSSQAITAAYNVPQAANMAAARLAGSAGSYAQYGSYLAFAGAIHDYNASPTRTGGILAAAGSLGSSIAVFALDVTTTGMNYVSNVFNLWNNCFR